MSEEVKETPQVGKRFTAAYQARRENVSALRQRGKLAEAEDIYLQGPQHDPNNFLALHLLGLITDQSKLRRLEDVLASCDNSVACKPDDAEAYLNRGVALGELRRYEEALQSFDRAIQLKPDSSEAYYNRGVALCELGRYEEALQGFDRAIQLKPDFAEAWFDAGKVYHELNCIPKAISNFETVLKYQPSNARARIASCVSELPILYNNESDIFKSRRRYEQKLRDFCADFELGRLNGDLAEAIGEKLPFFLAYQGYCDRDLQSLYGSLVCKIMHREYPVASLPPPPALGEPVRVGFVSRFFRNHSNWKIPIKGWISQLDRRRFKIFGYHLGEERDAETAAAAFICDRFVPGLTTVEICRKEILADAPHVLIYPGLLMDHLSLQLAAQRLAPVQCNSWGHPETSGMPTLDYFISSELMEPQDASRHYSEKLILLPKLSIYYTPSSSRKDVKKRLDFELRSDVTIFWCGQSLFKYLPQFDCVFANIAARVDNCQFVFIQQPAHVTEQFKKRLKQAFKRNGLNYANHCEMLPPLSHVDFIGAIGQCDLILDSIGWSGCNSTLESLEHNLPIVTLEGPLMRGRHSAAILRMMGATATIAKTVEEYISIAVRLANNPTERAAVSRCIAANKHRLFGDKTCISVLEDFLDRVVRQQQVQAR